MNAIKSDLQGGLEDLLGDLWYARRIGDLGRLALLSYCEVRRWARLAGEEELAEQASELITHSPHANRAEFLAQIDALIAALERQSRRDLGTNVARSQVAAVAVGGPA